MIFFYNGRHTKSTFETLIEADGSSAEEQLLKE